MYIVQQHHPAFRSKSPDTLELSRLPTGLLQSGKISNRGMGGDYSSNQTELQQPENEPLPCLCEVPNGADKADGTGTSMFLVLARFRGSRRPIEELESNVSFIIKDLFDGMSQPRQADRRPKLYLSPLLYGYPCLRVAESHVLLKKSARTMCEWKNPWLKDGLCRTRHIALASS